MGAIIKDTSGKTVAACENISELRRRMPSVVPDHNYTIYVDSDCLCPVNMVATAKANGYEATPSPDGFDWIVTPVEAAQ